MFFKAAVVGCGRIGCAFDDDPIRKKEWGASTHAGSYFQNPHIELSALCDIDNRKLEKYGKKFKVKNLFLDIDELLDTVKPDILSVCAPTDQHEKITIKAARSGVKFVFCEKPIATSKESALRMIKECEKYNTKLMVNHLRRFDSVFINIKKMINGDKLGNLQIGTFYYTAGIHNTGSHIIDLLSYYYGAVDWVIGSEGVKSTNSFDPNINGIIKFKNGASSTINSLNVNDYLIFEGDILGSKGRIRILSSGFNIEFYKISKSKHFAGYNELQKSRVPFTIPKKRLFIINAVNHILAFLENKRKPISTGYDALYTLQIIEALIKSAKHNSKKYFLASPIIATKG